ncbi:hypothetical protein [Helicobacter felis]|uniref:hypothetical protein n=1 Tax=Helicobacter felis TaxID=214 RepID=UPI001315517B|nr:hypothetical protein [Helicobacter felis]
MQQDKARLSPHKALLGLSAMRCGANYSRLLAVHLWVNSLQILHPETGRGQAPMQNLLRSLIWFTLVCLKRLLQAKSKCHLVQKHYNLTSQMPKKAKSVNAQNLSFGSKHRNTPPQCQQSKRYRRIYILSFGSKTRHETQC